MNLKYYLRGANNFLRYLIYEFPRGIDFSLRDLSSANLENNGYSLTTKKQLKNILKDIDFKDKRFLDIGSGKGGVICFAYELGAYSSKGIELDTKLHKRAIKNINILNYGNNVVSENIDARLFKEYDKFDIFFLFNLFNKNIYKTVLENIIKQNLGNKNSDKFIISYGEANVKFLNNSDKLEFYRKSQCPYRDYKILIYKFIT